MQQVNLYTLEFQPRKTVLPLAHISLLTLALLVLLVIATVLTGLNLDKHLDRLELTKNRVSEINAQVNELQTQVDAQVQDGNLVAANKRLRERIKAREQLLGVLDSLVVKGDEGFSPLLVSLARQTPDDLWLTRILIGGSGKNITLQGTTNNADAVPEYLQSLRTEEGFLGRTFTLFELSLDEQNRRRMNFQLRSKDSDDGSFVVTADPEAVTHDSVEEDAL